MNALIIAEIGIRQDAEGRYCLNDLHKASGGASKHQPRYWLANQQTEELVAELSDSGNPLSEQNQAVRVYKGGNGPQGTYACKELVYAYAMWISPTFNLKVIRAYDAMANGQVHAIPQTLSKSEALRLAADLADRSEFHLKVIRAYDAMAIRLALENQAQAEALVLAAPKVAFHDGVAEAVNSQSISEIAKILGTGQNRLFDFLRQEELLMSDNLPFQKYLDAGYFCVVGKQRTGKHGNSITYAQTLVTGKGFIYIERLFRARNADKRAANLTSQLMYQ